MPSSACQSFSFTTYLLSFPTRRSSDLFTISASSRIFCASDANSNSSTATCRYASSSSRSEPVCQFSMMSPVWVTYSILRSSALSTIQDRKSTRLNSSHVAISYAVFCLSIVLIYHLSTLFPYTTLFRSVHNFGVIQDLLRLGREFEFVDGDLPVRLLVIPLGTGVPVFNDVAGVGDVFDLAFVRVVHDPFHNVRVRIRPDGLLFWRILVFHRTLGQVLGVGDMGDRKVIGIRILKRIRHLIGQVIGKRILTRHQHRGSTIRIQMVSSQFTGEYQFALGEAAPGGHRIPGVRSGIPHQHIDLP